MRLLSSLSHIRIDSLFAMSTMGKCSLIISVSLRFMQVFSCSWKCFYTRVSFFFSSMFFDRGETEIRIEC